MIQTTYAVGIQGWGAIVNWTFMGRHGAGNKVERRTNLSGAKTWFLTLYCSMGMLT
jgi:hypothetical protein